MILTSIVVKLLYIERSVSAASLRIDAASVCLLCK